MHIKLAILPILKRQQELQAHEQTIVGLYHSMIKTRRDRKRSKNAHLVNAYNEVIAARRNILSQDWLRIGVLPFCGAGCNHSYGSIVQGTFSFFSTHCNYFSRGYEIFGLSSL
jgi:hypothetical protein